VPPIPEDTMRYVDDDIFVKIRDEYLHILKTHPNREEIKKTLLVSEDAIFKIYDAFPSSELPPEYAFYHPIC
jgi:hypothetical protein